MRIESVKFLHQSFRCFQNNNLFFFFPLAKGKLLLQLVVAEESPGLKCCITYAGAVICAQDLVSLLPVFIMYKVSSGFCAVNTFFFFLTVYFYILCFHGNYYPEPKHPILSATTEVMKLTYINSSFLSILCTQENKPKSLLL